MVPTLDTNHIVGDTRQHARFKDTQDESDATDAVNIGDEGRADRRDAEAQGDERDEPTRAHPLAAHVGRDLLSVRRKAAKTLCTSPGGLRTTIRNSPQR